MSKGSLTYRADIDGLRSIAILSVVLYHSFPTLVPAGFIGVDIFFVISGYLVSKQIFDGLNSPEGFNFIQFYQKRIRRLFPTLLIVLVFTLCAGWFILLSDEFQQLGKHLVGAAGFSSNFILLKEIGYFDQISSVKPLLHLWSLAVEEQYYLCAPIFFWALCRFRKFQLLIFVILACVSYGYGFQSSNGGGSVAFYLPFTRFWEFALGGMVSYIQPHLNWSISRQSLVSRLVGLGFIFFSLFYFTEERAFPGKEAFVPGYATLPTLGTLLLLSAGGPAPILSNRVMVYLGLVSYSFYLWHWPFLSFLYILKPPTPSPALKIIAILVSFLFAVLTYHGIEKPIRSRPASGPMAISLAGLLLLVGLSGFIIFQQKGISKREVVLLNSSLRTASLGAGMQWVEEVCFLPKTKNITQSWCLSDQRDKASFAIFGDSRAHALYSGLVLNSEQNKRWRLFAQASCSPGAPENSDCDFGNKEALHMIVGDPDIRLVILAVAERVLLPYGKGVDDTFHRMNEVLEKLRKSNKRFVFLVDNPMLPEPRSCAEGRITALVRLNQFLGLNQKNHPSCFLSLTKHQARNQLYRTFIEQLKARNPDLLVFDPTPIYCDTKTEICPISRDGKYLYSYGDHLSDFGSDLVAKDFKRVLQGLEF